MVERPLIKSEVRGGIPRISEIKDIEQLINLVLKTTEYSLIQEITSKIKILTSCLPTETKASSTVLNYWVLAQMVERSLSMREVRGSMPRISKSRVTHELVITISR